MQGDGNPHPILGDARLRQGIAFCTDREALIHSLYPWLEATDLLKLDSFLPSSHWAYPTDASALSRYPYDPARGMALFEAAGWRLPPGKTVRVNAAGSEMRLTLVTTTAEFRSQWTAIFKAQMQACGLEIELKYQPAEQFYSQDGDLQQRQFDLAVISGFVEPEPDVRSWFACDRIPGATNQWSGQNFAGWCHPQAETAIRTLTTRLNQEARRQAFTDLQIAYTQDLPALPLFSRLLLSVADPALQNFSPDPLEFYTWNAAEWRIPGAASLTIGLSAEPMGIFPLDTSYVSGLIQALVFGLDYTKSDYEYQPLTLARLPTLENGGAVEERLRVASGAQVVAANQVAVTLEPGVRLRDGNGNELDYSGGALEMTRLIVTYEFVPGLAWSDGAPVVGEDYEIAYRILCDPRTGEPEFLPPLPACDFIESVRFISATAYEVTWKPGYFSPTYSLPPFSRLPSHQQLPDGRRLADVPAAEWTAHPEIMHGLLGVGPYFVKSWDYGQGVVLEANPHYYRGLPAIRRIEIQYLPIDSNISPATRIAQNDVDLIGWDSLGFDPACLRQTCPPHLEALLNAQAHGEASLYLTASPLFEQLVFNLWAR